MRIARVVAVAVLAFPTLARAQADSIGIGDRVRVRVQSTRGNTNLFVGNVSLLGADTLTLTIPGAKGTITVPRSAISEVALSDGRESRLRNLTMVAPLFVTTAMLATLPEVRGPHSNALRNQRYLLIGLNVLYVARAFGRTPPERWRPVYSWLDRP